jgi:nitrate reductase NapAB chaperone NapD
VKFAQIVLVVKHAKRDILGVLNEEPALNVVEDVLNASVLFHQALDVKNVKLDTS